MKKKQVAILAAGVAILAVGAAGYLLWSYRDYVRPTAENLVLQTEYESYAVRQNALDMQYLEEIQGGEYTPEQPYIIVNPYEIAPQSALIVFETEEAVAVTTSILGKTEETTITNTIVEEKTYHELPLIGLYEGENTVEVTLSNGTTYSYTITTQDIPDNMLNPDLIEVLNSDVSQLSQGLYQLKNGARTLIDVNGDIRGYITVETAVSGADEVTEHGHVFVTNDEYTTYSTLMEFDYMGQMYREIHTNNMNTHHDAYLIDENTLLLGQSYIDLEHYEVHPYEPALEEIFNYVGGSVEVRNFGDVDALHLNTVADGGEGYILVSLRGQHAVAKLSFPAMEVQWVFSVYDETYMGEEDLYLTPIGEDFEWFYSQHDISMVSENGDGTMDITLFDNGVQRGMDPDGVYPTEELYSRMVHYRVDEVNMTVEQIWDYGEELGNEYLAYVHSSTQYIPESNTYLGAFDAIDAIETGGADAPRVGSYIVEVTEAGEIVYQLRMGKYNYRVEKLDTDLLYAAWEGIGQAERDYVYLPSDIVSYDGTTELQEESAIYQIIGATATQQYMDIWGWATIESAMDGVVAGRQLVLTNQKTEESYIYSLGTSAFQLQTGYVEETVRQALSGSAGFLQRRINISTLSPGDYRMDLIVTMDGCHYQTSLERVLRID